jgi:hypothetical protein
MALQFSSNNEWHRALIEFTLKTNFRLALDSMWPGMWPGEPQYPNHEYMSKTVQINYYIGATWLTTAIEIFHTEIRDSSNMQEFVRSVEKFNSALSSAENSLKECISICNKNHLDKERSFEYKLANADLKYTLDLKK